MISITLLVLVPQPVLHHVERGHTEHEEDHQQRNNSLDKVRPHHVDLLQELLRQHKVAVRLVAVQLGPIVAEDGHRCPLQCVLQEGHVKQPVHQRVGVVQMDEEPGEDQERTDEKRPEDGAILQNK